MNYDFIMNVDKSTDLLKSTRTLHNNRGWAIGILGLADKSTISRRKSRYRSIYLKCLTSRAAYTQEGWSLGLWKLGRRSKLHLAESSHKVIWTVPLWESALECSGYISGWGRMILVPFFWSFCCLAVAWRVQWFVMIRCRIQKKIIVVLQVRIRMGRVPFCD